MDKHVDNARSTILNLLEMGAELAKLADGEENIHRAEECARRARGYLDASQALLSTFGILHNELIEHPNFVALRRNVRKFGV